MAREIHRSMRSASRRSGKPNSHWTRSSIPSAGRSRRMRSAAASCIRSSRTWSRSA
ncbi:MAG: hypothetical protein DMD67_17555 [Gemmatimonadetes bacterium]|nr:MAG: hypothetical protein DMD67_17555 [Gemmatimonadota bacterium]